MVASIFNSFRISLSLRGRCKRKAEEGRGRKANFRLLVYASPPMVLMDDFLPAL